MLQSLGLQNYEKNFKKGLLTDQTLPLLTDRYKMFFLFFLKKVNQRVPSHVVYGTENPRYQYLGKQQTNYGAVPHCCTNHK
jgi:hypothetical protein